MNTNYTIEMDKLYIQIGELSKLADTISTVIKDTDCIAGKLLQEDFEYLGLDINNVESIESTMEGLGASLMKIIKKIIAYIKKLFTNIMKLLKKGDTKQMETKAKVLKSEVDKPSLDESTWNNPDTLIKWFDNPLTGPEVLSYATRVIDNFIPAFIEILNEFGDPKSIDIKRGVKQLHALRDAEAPNVITDDMYETILDVQERKKSDIMTPKEFSDKYSVFICDTSKIYKYLDKLIKKHLVELTATMQFVMANVNSAMLTGPGVTEFHESIKEGLRLISNTGNVLLEYLVTLPVFLRDE